MRKVFDFFLKKFNPYFYYTRVLGVKIGRNYRGSRTINFGSEPYLIEIGDDFYSSVGVSFVTHDGAINVVRNINSNYANADVIDKIVVGNNVFLGMNVTILPGSEIEDDVIVGAGSVVKGKLSKRCVYAGVPAKFICSVDSYVSKNEHQIFMTKSLSRSEKKAFLLRRFF